MKSPETKKNLIDGQEILIAIYSMLFIYMYIIISVNIHQKATKILYLF